MQSFYTARLHTPTTGDEQQQRDSSEAPTRQLREYSLTVTPQAIYHAPLTYDKMARVLSSKGMLVYPDQSMHALRMLVPRCWHNEKGMLTILTWLTPLLPEQPRSVRQLSERAAKSGWTCSVKAVEYSSGGGAVDVDTDDELSSKKTPKKLQIDAGQSDDWTIEVTMGRSESDGVGDDLLQACIAHAVEGQLHRNGWAFAGDRFLRMPSSFVASTVEAVQLNVTVTQQQQVTININVQSVKFQPIAGGNADLENLNVVERAVKILPDVKDGMITQALGIATTTNSRSLGVDRDVWLERYGYTLPPTFPVVQVNTSEGDWSTSTTTVPLCCCLTSELKPVVLRSRDEAAKTKQAAQHASTTEEYLVILKSLKFAHPETGTMQNLLTNFEKKEADPLLQAVNPFNKVSSSDVISSDIGFQSARALVGDDKLKSSLSGKKKPKVKLTIGASRPHSTTLSLAAIKASTLPPPSTPQQQGFGSGGGFGGFGGGGGFSSARHLSREASLAEAGWTDKPITTDEREKRDEDMPPSNSEDGPAPSSPSAAAIPKKSTPAKRKEPPPAAASAWQKKSTIKLATSAPVKQPAAKKPKTSVTAPTKSGGASKSTEAAASAKAKKSTSAAASTSKSKKSSGGKASWSAEFQAAFTAELSETDRQKAQAFKAMTIGSGGGGGGGEKKQDDGEKPAKKKAKLGQQTKLNFAA